MLSDDEPKLPTLDEFIANKGAIRNSYVTEPGFSGLYVRYSRRQLEGALRQTLDIASITAVEPDAGAFTRLFRKLRREHPELTLFVECVQTERFRKGLLERFNFTPAPYDPYSFYLPPVDGFS